MSKRKFEEVSDAERLEGDWNTPSASQTSAGLKKNSLDSDEEDDGDDKNYDILADDDIEGEVLHVGYSL